MSWIVIILGAVLLLIFSPGTLIAMAVIAMLVWMFLVVVEIAVALVPLVLIVIPAILWWRSLQEKK